ncbi:phosphoribosylaminoimidazolesuccinocarboxamide synthase [Candidatus Thorarchaeota archaeon]|nr:MAG: phosphoribosylaminoimidazolesuccinocarboxamide synthase [Candidatus Thorarchaeota archaeon]
MRHQAKGETTMDLIQEGKVKRVLQDPDSAERVIIEFTDAVTAGDGAKKEEFSGKGNVATEMSHYLFGYLEGKGIDTHYVKKLSSNQLLCKKVTIFPVEVVCRNIAAGSFCRRYGTEKGTPFPEPLVEFFLKDDEYHDPLITADAIIRLGLAKRDELEFMKSVTLSTNYYLGEILKQRELILVDFKLEFGKTKKELIVLADELSPDSMRIWDSNTTSMDKDVFREDKGDLIGAYNKVFEEIKKAKPQDVEQRTESIQVIVEPKSGIKNPPGEVTKKALGRLGFAEVEEVRVGKVFVITLKRPLTTEILNHLAIMNLKLLSNPISETNKVRIE